MTSELRAVPTPCIGVCTMGVDGMCHGCQRTRDEIARWLQMHDEERQRLMQRILPARRTRVS